MAVYFFQVGDDGPVKIGTANKPWRRLSTIRMHNHERIFARGIIDGSFEVEKQMHARFRKDRIRGEWFICSSDLREFMKSLSPMPKMAKRKRAVRVYDSATMKQMGSAGGKEKGLAAQAKRDAVMPRDKVQSLLETMSYAAAAEKIGRPFSASSLRRLYRRGV